MRLKGYLCKYRLFVVWLVAKKPLSCGIQICSRSYATTRLDEFLGFFCKGIKYKYGIKTATTCQETDFGRCL